MKYLLFFISLAAFAQVPRPGAWQTPAGGPIGGASSVATGQVLYGTGAGVAGSEAALAYNATDNRLTVGAPTGFLTMGEVGVFGAVWGGQASPSVSNYALLANGTETYLNSPQNLRLRIANADAMAIFPSTRNVGINTTTDDGTNKLQVAGSAFITGIVSSGTVAEGRVRLTTSGGSNTGFVEFLYPAGSRQGYIGFGSVGGAALPIVVESAVNGLTVTQSTAGATTVQSWVAGSRLMGLSAGGSLSLYNETPTTGVTQMIVRAGAGQGSTNLTTWQNAAGTTVANVDSGGNIFGNQVLNVADTARITGTGLGLASNRLFGFSSTTSSGGTNDASLSRQGPAVIQAGDGAANANGSFRGGFISQDGTTGVTVTTCTGFKNGLCISGT
jgi:hypothetical protein